MPEKWMQNYFKFTSISPTLLLLHAEESERFDKLTASHLQWLQLTHTYLFQLPFHSQSDALLS